jgi:hypothetical protein
MRLNLNALTRTQLESSALEAGAALDTLLPSDLIPASEETSAHNTDADVGANSSPPDWSHHPLAPHFEHIFHPTHTRTLTHARLGGMSALLTRFAVATVHRHAVTPGEVVDEDRPTNQNAHSTSYEVLFEETSNKLQMDFSRRAAEVDNGRSHLDVDSMHVPSSDNFYLQTMHDLDIKAFYSKLIIAWGLFFVFWTVSDRPTSFLAIC